MTRMVAVRYLDVRAFGMCRALLLALLVASHAGLANAQPYPGSFVPQGPAPTFGNANIAQSRDFPPDNGSLSGAIQAILVNPANSASMIIGTPNGGIWTTQNGGQSWNPVSDKLPSLSIASLAYNSTNSQIVYAGTGNTDNGVIGNLWTPFPSLGVKRASGPLVGVAQSSDGGNSWSLLSAPLGTMVSQSVVGVAGYTSGGTTAVFAATSEPNKMDVATGANNYGLYKSVNGGTFTLVNDGTTMPKGTATSLVGQGTEANPYYVAIKADASNQSGVFRSRTGGSSWEVVLGIPNNQAGRLAVAPGGAVAVALYDPRDKSEFAPNGGQIVGLQVSGNGTTWTSITNYPRVNPGNQANTDLVVALDPKSPNIVYVAGDSNESSSLSAISAYRVITNGTGTATLQSMTDKGTADNSTIHADARAIAFDASGRLLMASDGGIYALTNPQNSSGGWRGLNGSPLSLREAYEIAYDSRSKRLAVAAQDAGVALQKGRGEMTYVPLNQGDGLVATVDDRSYADSILYTSSQGLRGLRRTFLTAQGQTPENEILDPRLSMPGWNFVKGTATIQTDFTDEVGTEFYLPMATLFVLNRMKPSKIAIGSNYLYTTTQEQIQDVINKECNESSAGCAILNNVGGTGSRLGPITAIAYGAVGNEDAIIAGTSSGKLYFGSDGSKTGLVQKVNYKGYAPTSLMFGPGAAAFYIADGVDLFSSTNGGTSFKIETGNLSNGKDLNVGSPTSLEFINNNGVAALLVGGLNNIAANGIDSTSAIAVAKSDSSGNLTGWSPFGVNLPNTYVNTMTYNAAADVLVASLYGRGLWMLYDATSYFSEAKELWFGRADNDSTPVATQLTGSRDLIKSGTGTLTINVDSKYSGKTFINGGTLVANASLGSSSELTAQTDSIVSGIGTLPMTTIANATLAPGSAANPLGMLTVQSSLALQAASTYIVNVTPLAASSTSVVAGRSGAGTASLDGFVSAILQPGNYAPSRTFQILRTAGGLTGPGFAGTSTNFAFLRASLSYDANNAWLTIAPGGFAAGAQTGNQAAVGAALDGGVAGASGDFATVMGALGMMSAGAAPATFDQLSGQGYTGFSTVAVQTAQFFMNTFAQQVGGGQTVGRGGTSGRVALAEACEVDCDGPSPARWGAWGAGIGGLGSLAGNGSAYGLTYNIGGFAGGIDYRFNPNVTAGVTIGYTNGNNYTAGLPGSGTSNTVQFGLYGTLTQQAAYLDLLGGYARSANNMVRQIFVPGLAARTAFGQSGQDQFFGQAEAGYRLDAGGPFDVFVTPFARLQGSTATAGAFTEWGAQSLDLSVAAQTTNSLRTVLGSQFGGTVPGIGQDGLPIVLRVGWAHEYASTARPMTASFVGAPAVPFTVQGATAGADSLLVGFGASTRVGQSTSLYARYEGEIASGFNNHAFTAGVRMVW